MRFTENGPDIPEFLLQERDKGNVVFFCGAGVSFPAGLPGFLGLTESVLKKLGATEVAPASRLFSQAKEFGDAGPSLDQVFSAIFQKYPHEAVLAELNLLLKTPRNAPTHTHQTVLKLSKSAAGTPQIVTTNFDLLFEKASKRKIHTYVPPALPDIGSGQSIDGLVYLHGRLKPKDPTSATENRLIISSADFGRAYLAEAWATRFVRELLRNYVIVLLGYRAGDPPVKYLLEGLHARNDGQTLPIYAFDEGSQAQVEQNWVHRGVTPIPYERQDTSHSGLWETLELWAKQVEDPDTWDKSVIRLAQRKPHEMNPFQRGQVATFVRSKHGSQLFAAADPLPPPHWIAVFDRYLRCPKRDKRDGIANATGSAAGGQTGLRLDRDPNYDLVDHRIAPDPEDLLSSVSSDRIDKTTSRLVGYQDGYYGRLPSRLFDLTSWFERQMNSPILLWWVAGYSALSVYLLQRIEHTINDRPIDLHPNAQKGWSIASEVFKYSPKSELDEDWYRTQRRLNKGDYSSGALRQFERATKPYLSLSRAKGFNPLATKNDWNELRLEDVIEITVSYPGNDYDALEIPDEVKPKIYSIMRANLTLASDLHEDAGSFLYWRTPTLLREKSNGEIYYDDAAKYMFWFKKILDELAGLCPETVRSDFVAWKQDDIYFFDKFRLYLLMNSSIFGADQVAQILSRMSPDSFWNTNHRRELLHTLRARWKEFSLQDKKSIEVKITGGRSRFEDETKDDHNGAIAATASTVLGWLQKNSCELTKGTVARLAKLKKINRDWNESWIEYADDSGDGRSGWVKTEKDPTALQDLPISQLLSAAEENTKEPFEEFVRYTPFSGLVEIAPLKAVSALSFAAKREEYSWHFWRAAITNFPEDASLRLYTYFCWRLLRLPLEGIVELRHELPRFVEDRFEELFLVDRDTAFAIWDGITSKIIECGPDATKSGIGSISVGGQELDRSRKTAEHSLNSPIGKLSRALFRALDSMKLPAQSGLPEFFKVRFNLLFLAPGEGQHHFICEVTERIRWLYYIDPSWIKTEIVPFFDHDHEFSEAAWNGFLHNNTLPTHELFKLLKNDFLIATQSSNKWLWGNGAKDRLYDFFVIACYWHRKDRPYLTYSEARRALQSMDDSGRSRVAWFLGNVVKGQDAWRALGKPFLEQAWPREQEFITPATAKSLASLAEDAGETFEEVVDAILPYLAPVEHLHILFRRLKDKEGNEKRSIPHKFPRATLKLLDRLIPDDPLKAPYELGAMLEQIAEGLPAVRQDPKWRRLNDIINT